MHTPKIAIALLCLSALLLPVSAASAAPKPVIKLIGIHLPTHVAPGSKARLFLIASNIGAASTNSPLTLTDTLPDDLDPTKVEVSSDDPSLPLPKCEIDELTGQTVTCVDEGTLAPGRKIEVLVFFDVDPLAPKGALPDEATISGGGAADLTIDTTTQVSDTPAPFGFLSPSEGGADAPITEEDGTPATGAGSHPFQITPSVGFPTELPNEAITGAGHPRDIIIDFPRGFVVNPAATPVLCTEAQLALMLLPGPSCPPASQIGTVAVITNEVFPKATTVPLWNMVPPPGAPAMVAFDAAGFGVFIHISGELRSDGDFGITSSTKDALSLPLHPVFGAKVDIWGKPSDPIHDQVRELCVVAAEPCSIGVEPTKTALMTLPTHCPADPITTGFRANSWEQPDVFDQAFYEQPAFLGGCNALKFEPTIEARPTTNITDSPAALEFNLKQPQDPDYEASPTTNLKDATITLPEGLVVNPSAAQGQAACTSAQIGLLTPIGQAPIHLSKAPATCPDAAKLGTVEVESPLLAQRDESGTKVLRDANGHPIPRPLKGSLYLAKPFDNPFGTLLALYLDIEDAESGTVAKFAAKVSADPVSGRLTNTLIEGPDLPIEDVRVKLFEGPRAALRTPLACTTYTTTANLVPWSAPEGPAVQRSDSFTLTGAPGGQPCPATPQAAPHKPAFVTGTVNPQAGAYSPLILKVSREDGSQPIAGFEATLPRGLSAKFAGIPYCPEAAIAQARSRNRPNEGVLEQASPSCPAASKIGTIVAGAGAGPTPYHTTGNVYLAGPYKGAPLSSVIITPAVAGPFDLGTVVVRAALYVDPERAQGRVISDPLPTILEGIPLDLRFAYVKLDRPQFALNPTSCEPKEALATATSVFGQSASLSSRFQVGGCKALPFKPKFNLRLKGPTKRTGHPSLTVSGRFKPGHANLERASIAFPRSEFLDQAHIGTVCTRVQFAANQCPPRSVYGFAKARTPLLDDPLEGPVYLRSSSHELPDVVLALTGQVDIVLASRVDSLNGGIRVTAENVPDAPVTSFKIEMQGGRKGLLINSTNLCKKANYASVKLRAQNGKRHDFKALMQNDCKKKPKPGKGKGKKGKGR